MTGFTDIGAVLAVRVCGMVRRRARKIDFGEDISRSALAEPLFPAVVARIVLLQVKL